MVIETIKVEKNGVIKTIDKSKEKEYSKIGWVVVKDNAFPFGTNQYTPKK